mmetsp:Transcript_10748/g.22944  ORF Transcript_10748/g.22944 Transcript_10748/m.22944 type:complete len:145 (-) Transcript_10748:183-617(-)
MTWREGRLVPATAETVAIACRISFSERLEKDPAGISPSARRRAETNEFLDFKSSPRAWTLRDSSRGHSSDRCPGPPVVMPVLVRASETPRNRPRAGSSQSTKGQGWDAPLRVAKMPVLSDKRSNFQMAETPRKSRPPKTTIPAA